VSDTQEQRRAIQERMAREALPRLSVLADVLEALANEVFDRRIPYDPEDPASVMVLSFVTKQREHLRSVRLLLKAKQHRDAHVIARTMMEGLARLLWAFNRRPERTDLWFWFGAILDWRQTKKNEASGMAVDPGEKAELKTYVDKHGPNYYRPKVRQAIEDAHQNGTVYEIPEDPWANDWTPTAVADMFTEVEARRLYDTVYRDSSEWVHWGPRTILRAMQAAEWGVAGFTEEDWRAALVAMQLGSQSLMQTLEVLDMHFSLGITDRLAELGQRMVTIQTEALAAAR
jgi:hypothetical protein